MAKMTPRKKEEEKKKEDLTPFKFKESFTQLLLNNRFGGDSSLFSDTEQGWNTLDARGANGLRGTTERRKVMAELLKLYKLELEGKDYNFEGTSFKDKLDALNKIQAAIDALGTEEESDDLPAFSALGLNYRGFFSNGGNDPYTKGDYSGTYSGYNEWLSQLEQAKLKAELEKLKAQRANQYDNYKYYNFLNGTPSNDLDFLRILEKLSNQLALDGNDISRISWAFRQAEKAGGLVNLSKEELAKMPRYASTPGRLKKLQSGLDGIYYDTFSKRLILPQKLSQLLGITLLSILDLNNPETKAKLEELKRLQAANRKLSEGWETEDYARMFAMGLDIAGSLAAWAPGYGTAASGILGLTSLGTNMAADIADESLTKWDVAKNGLVNAGLAVVGMVPGLGLASKTGKWITNVAKWAPRLLTLQAIKDLPDSYNSLQKAINKPNELTNTDWRNIAYGLSVVAGLSRGVSGFAKNRIYKPAFTENTEKQYTITTSKGKKTIKQEQVDKIKKLNPKDKEKYNEEVKKVLKLADDETINIKDLTALGKTIKSKGIEIKEENVPVGLSPKAKAYREYLENRNNSIKNGEGIYKYAPRFLPTNYDIYKGAATLQIPGFNISDRLRNIWNPLSDKNLLKKGIKVEETPKATETKSAETSKIDRLRMNELKEKFGRSKTESSNPKLEYNLKQLHRADVEIELFIKSYGENGKSSNNSFSHGYGSNKNKVKNGEITIELGDGIKFSYKVNNASEYKNNPGKVSTLRGDVAKKVQEQLSSTKNVDRVKIGKILRELKRKGWLKQGGTINPSLDTIIEDFIKNNNI